MAGPERPDALEYLYRWALELVGRSGVGMAGLAPLTYGTVMDWAALTGRRPRPFEVEALMRLDAILRDPATGSEEEDDA